MYGVGGLVREGPGWRRLMEKGGPIYTFNNED